MNTAFGGLEVFFNFAPDDVVSVTLLTNIFGYASFSPFDNEKVLGGVSTRISSFDDSGIFIRIETLIDGEPVDRSDYSCGDDEISLFKVRVFYFNSRISVYLNDKWVYSYVLETIQYAETNELELQVDGGDLDISDIRRVELYDGRDAVYIDYEATSDSVIQSIIQQRPIDFFPGVDRVFEFTYDALKDDVAMLQIKSYNVTEASNSQTSSDGLVYAADVGISVDHWTAENVGFITKMYRLSELDTGAERAAAAAQKRARQSRFRITMSGRLDPRLEIADVQTMTARFASGTNREMNERSIVEDITINLQDGIYSMTVIGRRDVDVI